MGEEPVHREPRLRRHPVAGKMPVLMVQVMSYDVMQKNEKEEYSAIYYIFDPY